MSINFLQKYQTLIARLDTEHYRLEKIARENFSPEIGSMLNDLIRIFHDLSAEAESGLRGIKRPSMGLFTLVSEDKIKAMKILENKVNDLTASVDSLESKASKISFAKRF